MCKGNRNMICTAAAVGVSELLLALCPYGKPNALLQLLLCGQQQRAIDGVVLVVCCCLTVCSCWCKEAAADGGPNQTLLVLHCCQQRTQALVCWIAWAE